MSKTRDPSGKFASAKKMGKAAQNIGEESAPNQITMANNTNDGARQYPTKYLGAASERDRLNLLKLKLQNKNDGRTPFGQLQWSDEMAQWLLKKQDAAKAAAFQEWFAKKYDKASFAEKRIARELFPRFYQERLKTLDTNLKTLRQVARLQITGPQTAKDLAMLYAIDKGMIDVHHLKNLVAPDDVPDELRQLRFRRGLLNFDVAVFGNITGYSEPIAATAEKQAIPRPQQSFFDSAFVSASENIAYSNDPAKIADKLPAFFS